MIKKRLSKNERERAVLLALVELYIKMKKPIGSQALKEYGFADLSSATIRNYFGKLEQKGFLHQSHASGGRIPKSLAFREYANYHLFDPKNLSEKEKKQIQEMLSTEQNSKQIVSFLQSASEALSELTKCSVFYTSPRFDQDFIQDIKLLMLDQTKVLLVMITDFGLINTETMIVPKALQSDELSQIEATFLWRMGKGNKPNITNPHLLKLSGKLYNEMMVRHVVNYAFPAQDIFKTGLAKLLEYPQFNDPCILAQSLSLFENDQDMRVLLNQCMKRNRLTLWIGDDLEEYTHPACSIIAVPYYINKVCAGAIAILGPEAMSYKKYFSLMQAFSDHLSKSLTSSVYKHKITFRQPSQQDRCLETPSILLEDKSQI